MDLETATTVLVVSNTIVSAWGIYLSYYWFLNNCACI